MISTPTHRRIATSKSIGVERLKSAAAQTLLSVLSAECAAWCLLSGYDRMPDHFDTDIDFLVSREDFSRIPSILARVAGETGMTLCQAIEHEPVARAFFLFSVSADSLVIVQPDCASDYYHFGKRWLRGEEILASRRRHSKGFWIPSPAHEFAYRLIKRLNKSRFSAQDGQLLSRLYRQDGEACERMLRRFFPATCAVAIQDMAAEGEWSAISDDVSEFRNALMRGRPRSLRDRIAALPSLIRHTLARIVQPTGLWIAFIGPDGCGKSTVLRRVSRELAGAFRGVDTYHLRPRLIGRRAVHNAPVSDPHARPPRGLLASIVKAGELLADYLLGYGFRLRPALIRSALVVFDRCFDDLVVDSRRIRYGGPQWVLQLVAFLAPRPDLVILLDAPPEVLWARKQEVPFEEVVRQRTAYLEMARSHNSVVVDGAQPVPSVVHDVLVAVRDHLARRTQTRLGLPAPIPSREARCADIQAGGLR